MPLVGGTVHVLVALGTLLVRTTFVPVPEQIEGFVAATVGIVFTVTALVDCALLLQVFRQFARK
jgi:hypothetical protein